MEGWIKLHRKMLDNPIVCKDAETIAIWIYLLLNATHKEVSAVFKGEKIDLQPGQLITGRKSMASKLKITESKIQRTLNCFESEHQIKQQTSNQNRLITILRWNEYQSGELHFEHQMNNERTTDEQPVNTNKNVKNDNNDNNIYFSYFINKIRETDLSTFQKRMNFLHNIQEEEEYKHISPDEEHELRMTVMRIKGERKW
jgi:hypothetical protein